MSNTKREGRIELVHPLYLDVPMMTSFLAAIEGGIAYDANIKTKQGTQKERGFSGEGEAGVPKVGMLSSVLSLSLRGKIENKNSSDDNEEVELVRKHTESSLFMQLRSILHRQDQVVTLESQEDLASISQGSLVEVTGQILRSPAGAALEGLFRMINMLGIELPDDTTLSKATKSGQHQNQSKKDPLVQLQAAYSERSSEFTLKMMQRLKDDLTKSNVVDVVMQLSSKADISVVLSLSPSFFPEGTFDNILSGHFTVLGKVTRILEENEEINLYQRSIFGNMLLLDDGMRTLIEELQKQFASSGTVGRELVKAPGIQVIPLAVFV